MKTVRRAVQVMACIACLASTQATLADGVQRGFYLGAGLGKASFDIDKSKVDGAILNRFVNQGRVENYKSTLDDSDSTFALFAGYHFNPYISIEAGYIDLGSAEYAATADVYYTPVAPEKLSTSVTVESTGFTLAGLGRLPIGNAFDLHGRFGVLSAQTDRKIWRKVSMAKTDYSESLDSTEAFYSVGVGFTFPEYWSLSLDWTRYADVGDENDDDLTTTEGIFDVDALSFSAKYRF